MKSVIAEYVEHLRSVGTLRPLIVLKWKWDEIATDLLIGLPRVPSRDDTIWVIVIN